MRFRVLGSLEAVHEGEHVPLSGMKAKALALLLLERGRWIPAQRFTAFLWDEEPPSTAVRQVQNTVAALRRLLAAHGGDPIERSGHGYRLVCEDIDLVHFERGVAAGREAMRAGAAEAAAERFERALGQWRGAAFADLSGDRLAAAAARLERERTAAIEALNEADLAAGRSEAVITRARELLDADPYHQRAAAQYMHALHARGRGPEALEFYTLTRVRMAEDLGLDPGPELREAQRRVLDADAEPAETPALPAARVVAVPAQLPAAVSGFCGRDTAIKELDELLCSPSKALRIAVVSGPGGVGKTSLAVEWAHRVRDRFPDGQLYVDLRGFHPDGSALDPAGVLHAFLTAFGVPVHAVPTTLESRASLFRSLSADRRLLVVLDNACDAEQVGPLLPGSPDCMVLVTSRRLMQHLVIRNSARQVRLDVLERSEARLLLDRRLGAERASTDPEAVERILETCADLPLALAIAGARAVAESRFPLRTLADRLGSSDGVLDVLEIDDQVGDVRAVFSWSYDALSPDAARLFRLTGLHPGPDFSTAAAASLAAVPVRRARTLLRELTGMHLLTEPRPGRFATHDLVAAYAREKVEDVEGEAERTVAQRRMLGHYLGSACNPAKGTNVHRERLDIPELAPGTIVETFDDGAAAMAWVRRELAVLGTMVGHAEELGFDAFAAALGWAIADPLHQNGDTNVGLASMRCALRAAERLGDRKYIATAHIYLTNILSDVGEFESAEAHLRRASELCVPGGDDRLPARVEYWHSVLLERQGRYVEALPHCKEALRLYRRSGSDRDRVRALSGISWLQSHLGLHDEAIEHCRQSLELSEAIGSTGGRAFAIESMGYTLYRQGNYSEAMEYLREAIELHRAVNSRHREGMTRLHMGDVQRARGRTADARHEWRLALSIFEDAWSLDAEKARTRLAELASSLE